jgi:hypothetical protein
MQPSNAIPAALLAATLAACVTTQDAQAPIEPIACSAGPDCDVKWSRAIAWISSYSRWPMATLTDKMIQTTGPFDEVWPAYTVTKVPLGPWPGAYEIQFAAACGKALACAPEIPEAGAEFQAFVLATP